MNELKKRVGSMSDHMNLDNFIQQSPHEGLKEYRSIDSV